MRELKFRAKHKQGDMPVFRQRLMREGTWVYGDLCTYGFQPRIYDNKGDVYPIDPNTIGQYTGLKDKNGQKIYEGDIVVRRDLVFCTENVCEVVYNGVIAGFRLLYKNGVYLELNAFLSSDTYNDGYCTVDVKYEYEVIGNIYDNPEMLRKK